MSESTACPENGKGTWGRRPCLSPSGLRARPAPHSARAVSCPRAGTAASPSKPCRGWKRQERGFRTLCVNWSNLSRRSTAAGSASGYSSVRSTRSLREPSRSSKTQGGAFQATLHGRAINVQRAFSPTRLSGAPPAPLRHLPDVVPRGLARQEVQILVARHAHHLADERQLVDGVTSGEDGPSTQHLGEDAPHRPEVDPEVVAARPEKQLGRPVPPGHDVVAHEGVLVEGPGEAKVADLQAAVGVDEEVGRVQVAMHDVGGVRVGQAGEELRGEAEAAEQPFGESLAHHVGIWARGD